MCVCNTNGNVKCTSAANRCDIGTGMCSCGSTGSECTAGTTTSVCLLPDPTGNIMSATCQVMKKKTELCNSKAFENHYIL